MDDHDMFAEAIYKLDTDRNYLETLSLNCRKKITEEFDVKMTAKAYHTLFSEFPNLYRRKKLKRTKVGARLDQLPIPSFIMRYLRTYLSPNGK